MSRKQMQAICVEPELWKEFKEKAHRELHPMSALIRKWIREYLKED